MRLLHTMLRVGDLQRSIDFYTQVLGMQLLRTTQRPEQKYDLAWNSQRIEQRIGRCHRYGQKFDVVVVNFLNKNNAADKRVYELLAEKFRLFSGVFGASDEVLEAVESGGRF